MTPLGGIFTGTVVLLALEFLTDAFQYIPSSALGAVIIMAVINLFSLSAMIHVGRVNGKFLYKSNLLKTFFILDFKINL